LRTALLTQTKFPIEIKIQFLAGAGIVIRGKYSAEC
jgi:hypothetical protein